MADGDRIIIGQANKASKPGNETSLSRNEGTASTVFVAQNLNVGAGIHGKSVDDTGVRGTSDSGAGVGGTSASDGSGVAGRSDSGPGVMGYSKSGKPGVQGFTTSIHAGVQGMAPYAGVDGVTWEVGSVGV